MCNVHPLLNCTLSTGPGLSSSQCQKMRPEESVSVLISVRSSSCLHVPNVHPVERIPVQCLLGACVNWKLKVEVNNEWHGYGGVFMTDAACWDIESLPDFHWFLENIDSSLNPSLNIPAMLVADFCAMTPEVRALNHCLEGEELQHQVEGRGEGDKQLSA